MMGRLSRQFSFRGRTARLHYWQVSLAWGAVALATYCLFMFLAITLKIGALAAVGLAAVITSLIPTWAAVVRRVHDRNKSAWWLLIFHGPILAVGAAPQSAWALARVPPVGFELAAVLSLVLWLWGIVEISFLRGTAGPNRYGPDPYAART